MRSSLQANRKILIPVVVMISFLLPNYFLVRSQNNSGTGLKGETQRVAAVSNKTNNAGEIIFKIDTDHDGMADDDELRFGFDPNNPADADGDADGDGLSNADEISLGTNPNVPDTDGDGASDADEVRLGFNPLDPASTPPTGAALAGIRVTPDRMALNINSVLGAFPASLTVIGVLLDGSTIDITRAPGTRYQSQNPAVAIVDDLGTVAAVAPGTTFINVTNGSLSTQTSVIVASTAVGPTGGLILAPGVPGKVDVSGGYAFVAEGPGGLQIVDVNDRSNPHLATTVDTPGEVNGIKVITTRAYIADGSGGLRIVDVTNPASPVLLGSVDTPGDAQDVVVYGSRAYIADGPAGLQIIDVSNPQSPSIIGSVNVAGTTRGVDVSGSLAVLAMSIDGIRVADVSNPASPVLLGALPTAPANDLRVEGRVAYIASPGFKVVNFSTPSTPLLISSLPDNTSGDLLDLVKVRNLVLGADTFSFAVAVPMIDVSSPASAAVRGYVSFPNFGRTAGIAADDRFVYVSTPTNTLLIGQYFQPDDIAGIAPTIAITSPQNGLTVLEGSHVTLAASASDDALVTQVQFLANGQVVSTDSITPYQYDLTVPLNISSLTIGATAADQAGYVGTAAPVTLNVAPDPPPTVTITSPPAGTQLVQERFVTISADASDNVAVDRVIFTVNGVVQAEDTTAPYSLVYAPPSGVTSLAIEARAVDNLGRSTTDARIVAYNPPPLVTITSPHEGSQISAGFTINFAANVTDDGQVARVDFIRADSGNETLLQSLTSPPFSTPLTFAPNESGDRTLKVVATDDLGGRTSVMINVVVRPDPLPTVAITSPDEGTQLIEGQLFTAVAVAGDNIRVDQVRFALNGVESLPVTTPPYSQGQRVPIGITSLTLQATATDNFGQTATATRTFAVLENQPPTVTLTSPAEGAQLFAGQTITLAADAADDNGVEQVFFTVNGSELPVMLTPPYTQSYVIPVGTTSLFVQATATDIFGKSASASRTIPVLDPLTAVIGRVTDVDGFPIEGAVVTLNNSNGRTTTTDSGGAFSFGAVATVPQGIRLSVSVDDATSGRQGHSALVPPVPGGTTDLGIVALASVGTTALPTTPSANGKGDYTGDSQDDLFAGFSDRQSRVYVSDGLGQFTQSGSLTLPFGAVRAGASVDLNNDGLRDILAQPVGQPGSVTAVFTDGTGGIGSIISLPTGLGRESDAIAAAADLDEGQRRVLAFLAVTGGSTITVSFSDGAGGFTAPVELPITSATHLRSLKLVDVTGDLLVDLIAINQTSETGGSVLVFPRVSGTEFGAPVESPVTLRSDVAVTTTSDYVIGDFDGDLVRDLAVLDDGRVRVYRGNNAGSFSPLDDVVLPPGTIATAIATPYAGAITGEDLVVVVRDADSAEFKSVLMYENHGFGTFGGFAPPIRLNYVVEGSTGDSILLVGHFGGESFIEDAAIIDGETVTAFLDVIR
jgi:hypothetical protein